MAGSPPQAQRPPALLGIQVQTSTAGAAIPLVWGRTRIPGNLLWYGDFRATSVTEPAAGGGKGGGGAQGTEKWVYDAAVLMGLCGVPLRTIVSGWKGKQRFQGESTLGKVVTLTHAATVPGSPYQITLPVPSGNVLVGVQRVWDPTNQGSGIAFANSAAGAWIEGSQYTRSGAVLTFRSNFQSRQVRISYQVQDPTVTWSNALAQLGLEMAAGYYGQPVWAHLATNHAAQAIGYSGVAYVYAASYRLNDQAQVENHTFEVSTTSEYSETIPDADMAVVLREFLTDGQRGVQWPEAYLADLSAYSTYVRAFGLFMSPALQQQEPAAEILGRWLKLTNSDAVMSGGQLKIVPLGDAPGSANGATYTPATTPAYDLGPDDLLNEGRPRVKVVPRVNEDTYNVVRVEYLNRDNAYNVDIAEARDRAHIELYGERVMQVIKAHEVTTPAVAGFVAQMELQRQMAVLNDYEFALPWTKGRLEPLDLVTLTTGDELALDRVPVRIDQIEEAEDGQFEIRASDAPIGHASAPLFGVQAGSGYQADYNAAAPNVDAPVIFELPADQTTTGLALAIAVRGTGPDWGGCQVWISLDGTNYRLMAVQRGGARYGTVAGATSSGASSMGVQGLGSAQLLSGSALEAGQGATLCYVGGANPEYMAHQSVTLTGVGAYTLFGLLRGLHGTAAASHAAGDAFVRVDGALTYSDDLDPSYIGKTVYFKFCSFNPYGGGMQGLADVSAVTYTITGAMAVLQPASAGREFRGTAPANPRVGDVLIEPAFGNRQSQWNGSAWVSMLVGTEGLGDDAATILLTDYEAGPVSVSSSS